MNITKYGCLIRIYSIVPYRNSLILLRNTVSDKIGDTGLSAYGIPCSSHVVPFQNVPTHWAVNDTNGWYQ